MYLISSNHSNTATTTKKKIDDVQTMENIIIKQRGVFIQTL